MTGTSSNSAWEKTKQGGKAGFDKGWSLFEKLGAPVNKLTNRIGSEAFWPTDLEKVCDYFLVVFSLVWLGSIQTFLHSARSLVFLKMGVEMELSIITGSLMNGLRIFLESSSFSTDIERFRVE